jgi:hypothetical protein
VSTLRSRLVSHRAKRIILWFFAVVFAAAIALRVEAAIYAGRIVSSVRTLSTLRVGETSEAETLSRIPSLRPSSTGPYGTPRCDADECFSAGVHNGLPRLLLWRNSNDSLSHILRWWGFRGESLSIYVNFTSGRVSYFSYHLMVSAPGIMAALPPPPTDGKLGVLIVGLHSEGVINVRDPNSTVKLHPPYSLNAVSSQSIGIHLSPNAPAKIVRDAFDLRLNCVWNFGGCRRWSELLPSVEPRTRN